MYLSHFGLSVAPFAITTDPQFLFLSEKHREALAHLLYSTTQQGGFILLTGEIGAGKTTLCRHFLNLIPSKFETAFIYNPKISPQELLATICQEFRANAHARSTSVRTSGLSSLTNTLTHRLLAIRSEGKQALLVVDEAQSLSAELLEQIRLLTNLESTNGKLLQIILIGQPELRDFLSTPELRQLSQRIVARYHLTALSKKEVFVYIRHRLSVAGCNDTVFSADALEGIYLHTQGVPRLVNVLCDRALLGAYVNGVSCVDANILKTAANEVFGNAPSLFPRRQTTYLGIAASTLVVAAASYAYITFTEASSSASISETPSNDRQHKQGPRSSSIRQTPTDDSLNIRSTLSPDENLATAYAALLEAWSANTTGASLSGCDTAKYQGLQCFHGEGNWSQLVSFNYPAVLTLIDSKQRKFYATLVSINDQQDGPQKAELFLDGIQKKVPLEQLAFHWTGHYTLLWRPPLKTTNPSSSYAYGLPPEWFTHRLGSHPQETPLTERVKLFQRNNSLPADGIIGPRTMMLLSAFDERSPKLRTH